MKTLLSALLAVLLLTPAAVMGADIASAPVKGMSAEEQAKMAVRAAPPRISNDASIMVYDKDGKLVKFRAGINGFTCMPDVEGQEVPDPICYDEAAAQWMNDFVSGAPKPTNATPGIAYMAMGGWHWEADGKILPDSKDRSDAKRVKEPPHWMILFPFTSKATGLPSKPLKDFGAYIMYDATPYSHLMVYQDPLKMK